MMLGLILFIAAIIGYIIYDFKNIVAYIVSTGLTTVEKSEKEFKT